jgi:hypothetical protein
MGGPIKQRSQFLRDLYETRMAKAVTVFGISASAYQFLCDQFGFPTIPQAWNMMGVSLPWWGWLLVAQTGLIYGLFEYVRIHTPALEGLGQPRPVNIKDLTELNEARRRPKPDISLITVGTRVSQLMGINAGIPAFERQVNLDIVDKINMYDLTVWGRYGEHAIEALPRNAYRRLTVNFRKGEVYINSNQSSGKLTYTHVQFVKSEVDGVWPPREEPTPSPG